jgi:hypothetical protein
MMTAVWTRDVALGRDATPSLPGSLTVRFNSRRTRRGFVAEADRHPGFELVPSDEQVRSRRGQTGGRPVLWVTIGAVVGLVLALLVRRRCQTKAVVLS